MTGIRFCGTGSYLPPMTVDNGEYAKIVDTSDEWIRPRTGIVTRHIANGETTWRMGARAARAAIDDAGIDPAEIGLVLVTTVTADFATPSMSCCIQQEIGAKNAMCIDVNCACAAFVYAVDMARRYLATGDGVDTVLVVSTEMLSRLTNYADRSTCVLFGDGAGACVIRAEENAMYGAMVGADGSGYGLMFCKNPPPASPWTTNPPEPDEVYTRPELPGQMVMGGREIYKFATKMMPQAINTACARAGITSGELDWIVPHQANVRIVQTAMKNLGLPMEKAFMTIDHTGNTSSASAAIALDELNRSGRLRRGDKVGIAGFGAGLTYGGAVFTW